MSLSTETNRLAQDLDNILERTESLWQELRGQRILITGATGFFGCWLLESFAWANRRLDLNARAVGLSRHPDALAGKAPHLAQDAAITLHAADVRHGDFPQGTFSHVIHAANEASAKLNSEAPLVMFDTIVEGTRRALQFSIASSVGRFLLVSSGAVYGNQPPELTHVRESFEGGPDPLNAAFAYAEGKRSAEMLCTLAASPRLATTVARCFTFVGPYMELDAHFAINVGSEDALNIAALADEVAAALPPAVAVNVGSVPTPGAPGHRYVPSTARAREELGLSVEVPLREAIRRTDAWFSGSTFSERKVSRPKATARGIHA
jgi:dTDP-glucose 4,6-dehydratase